MMRPYDGLLTYLSFSRVAIAALIILVFDPANAASVALSLGLYVLGHLTDHLDGWVARNLSFPTDKGFVIDAVCDKLFQIGCLLPIHLYLEVSIVLFWLVLVREFAVVSLLSFIDKSDLVVIEKVSRFSYWFVGFIRLATVLCFLVLLVPERWHPSTTAILEYAGLGTYILAVFLSYFTLLEMSKQSKARNPQKLVRRSQKGEDPD